MFRRSSRYLIIKCSTKSNGEMNATFTGATFSGHPDDKEDVEVDNSILVAEKISSLYVDRVMNDISLSVGNETYPAHKLILCASSEVFQAMLLNPQWEESHQSQINLQETPQCSEVFGTFLRYLYTGQIKINHTSVMPILMLADKYNVKDLVQLCVEYMCSHVAHAVLHGQMINWFHYTLQLGHFQIAQACENFLKWNFGLASSSPDFVNCDVTIMERLVQHSDLVVSEEMEVYKSAVKWLEAQRKTLQEMPGIDVENEMSILVERIMKHIRFPMMTTRQLAELFLSPLPKDFIIKRMAVAMAYHSDGKDLVDDACLRDDGLGRMQFTPRLYTAEQFRCQLNVENYNSSKSFLSHTLVFSSQTALAEHVGEQTCDWVIDLYPKGVWFRKCFLIVLQGTVEVPESIMEKVRVSITCKDSPQEGIKVKLGLLTLGEQDGVEHIMAVTQCVRRFTPGDNVLNLDGIMSFDDLNSSSNKKKKPSPFLIGPDKNTLKVVFVIVPLSDLSVTDVKIVPLNLFMKK